MYCVYCKANDFVMTHSHIRYTNILHINIRNYGLDIIAMLSCTNLNFESKDKITDRKQ